MVPNGTHFALAADFKAPIRVEIERAGYSIVANIGDQSSDLQGVHAERCSCSPIPSTGFPKSHAELLFRRAGLESIFRGA